MADRNVAIRLAATGAAEVKRDLTSIGDSGDAAAKRWAKAYEAAGADVEAAVQRQARAAEKVAAIMPQTPTQAIYQAGASTNFDGASARDSASAYRELLAEESLLEAKARALVNVLEPLRVAQEQYNASVNEASVLHDRGKISLAQFMELEQLYAAQLARTTGAARTAEEAEAALMAARTRANGSPDTIIVGKSAQDSAGAFTELLAQEEALQKRVDALRASIDPASAAQARFNVNMGEARALIGQGAISLDEYCAKLRVEQAELANGTGALTRHAGGFAGMGIAGMEAEHVVRAFSDSIAAGQAPVRALAMELPRVSEAMMFWSQTTGQTEGAMGKLAMFMGGPWGLALSAGLAVLGPLVAELFKGEDASDKLKIKTIALEDALRREAIATAEAKKALDDYNAKQDEARKNDSLAIDNQLKLADARLKDALATREQTRAKLAAALADEEQARGAALDQQRYGTGEAATVALQFAQGRSTAIEKMMADENATIGTLQQTQRNLLIEHATRSADEATDPVKRINDQYDRMADKANRAASSNTELAKSLDKLLISIERQRGAALDAEKQQDRSSANRQYGNTIDAVRAASIVRGIGGQVNSGTRSHTDQQRLYDDWVAHGRPSDNPVAVPGTSAHERGNALDVQFAVNLSPAKLKEAFQAEGVRLTKIFAERGHWHIEWADGGAAKKADSDAKAAGKEQDRDLASVQNQFDPAAKAAREYRDALEEIGKAKLDPATVARYTAAAHDAFVQARASAFTLGDVETMRPAYDANTKNEEERTKAEEKKKEFLAKLTTDQGDALAESQADLGLVRQTNGEHDRQIAKLELIQQLKEEGVALDSDDAKQRLAIGDAIETNREKLKALQDDWNEIKQTGEQFLNDLTNPDGSGLKNLLKDIEQEFIKLALLNPLKNLLFHDNAPTLGSVFGSLGSLFGHGDASSDSGTTTTASDVLSGVAGFGHNASGTENWSGGKTWVNENGPELVDLPSGSRIIPAAATRRMLANDNQASRVKVDIGLNTELFTATVAQTADQRVGLAAPMIGNGAADLANQRYDQRLRRRMR